MRILAMLLLGIGFTGALYKSFYLPTQTERNTALGVKLTEEGLESRETRGKVRRYRLLERCCLVCMGAVLAAAVVTAFFNQNAGILVELFGITAIWQVFFYIYQKYRREIIWLKYNNHWFDDTTKHICRISEHMDRYAAKPVKDLLFVPLYLLPFLAFFYPGTREYLRGNLWHGFWFLLPFVILLFLQGVYYAGILDRNLIFTLACMEEVIYLIFQWELLVEKNSLWKAGMMYVLFLVLLLLALAPWLRGILADRELRAWNFPERIPSEGEELWLYGCYRNKKDKAVWVKNKFGGVYVLNYGQLPARIIGFLPGLLWYAGIAYCIWKI